MLIRTNCRFDFTLSLTGKTFRIHLGHALYVNLLPAHERAHASAVKWAFISDTD